MSAALAVKDTDLGEKLRVALADRAEVSLGLVFGSRARGTGGPASDLDVAVMAPGPSPVCADIASHLIADEGWPPARTLGEGFSRLEENGVVSGPIANALRDAVGLRNIVAHGYAGTDIASVHLAATQGVADLDAFARAVADWTAKRSG